MRLGVLVISLTAGGCCGGYPEIEREPPPGAEQAIEMIRAEFGEVFNRNPDVRVRWTSETWTDGSGAVVRGESWGCEDIWVYAGEGDRPSDTGLAHELAHCYAGHIDHCGLRADDSHSEEWIWDSDSGLVAYVEHEVLAPAGL